MSRNFIIVAAWTVFAGIAYVTLSPIGLRPQIADPNLERFGAFAVLGLLLGMAYPGRQGLFAALIVGDAVGARIPSIVYTRARCRICGNACQGSRRIGRHRCCHHPVTRLSAEGLIDPRILQIIWANRRNRVCARPYRA
jgi:hypothetical protein